VTSPPGPQLFVQRYVDRRQFYSAVSVTAHFVASLAGEGLEDFESTTGTAFIVRSDKVAVFVTNRHVLDYNYKQANPVASAVLKSVTIRGFAQPQDSSQSPIPWTYSHPVAAGGIIIHPDQSTDLAVIRIFESCFAPPLLSFVKALNVYASDYLASATEIHGLWPGEEVFIVGYPGIAGASERPVLVTGVIASDPRYPAVFGNAKNLKNAVLCQSFSWRGMSGAPVLGFSESIGKTKIIGINAGHVGGSGAGVGGVISHFVRSDALIQLLEQLS